MTMTLQWPQRGLNPPTLRATATKLAALCTSAFKRNPYEQGSRDAAKALNETCECLDPLTECFFNDKVVATIKPENANEPYLTGYCDHYNFLVRHADWVFDFRHVTGGAEIYVRHALDPAI